MDLAVLLEFVACAARSRYLSVGGYSWVVYDWMITLGQEIDLVWKRSGAWTSKLLYAFTRYLGLALSTLNLVVAIRGGWSHDFCQSYFYVLGFVWTAHLAAVQSALLLRIYVMYHRSTTILVVNSVLFACEMVSLTTLVGIDVSHYTATPGIGGISGCWSTTLNHNWGTAMWWITLSFETYLCTLVLGPAFSYWKSSKRTSGARVLSILIRDSFVWYFTLAACLLLNAVAWTTDTPRLVLIGIPLLNSASTIGSSRLLLNLRAAYFSSLRNPNSPTARRSGNTDFFDTQGTVGRFWSSRIGDKDDDQEEDCAASISMGVWSNEDVQRNAPPTPPQVIMLKPAPPGRRFLKRPSSSIVVGGDEGAPSSSGLSVGPGEDLEQSRPVEISVWDFTERRPSNSIRDDSIQCTKDPDIESGTWKQPF